MKLSISNIAWDEKDDEEMLKFIKSSGYGAIEIAPTRIIRINPYSHIEEAKKFADNLQTKYNIKISSMQSIWFGKEQKIFGTQNERNELIKYTKEAIDFAEAVGCSNLVFGCPRNRVIDSNNIDKNVIIDFLKEIGYYAISKSIYFSVEPNPIIYNTNFINTTSEAIELIKMINNNGIKLNVDLGTIIYNNEDINFINENVNLINHVHVSEPYLEIIKPRKIHKDLIKALIKNKYNGYISIEMKNQDNIQQVKDTMIYLENIYKEISDDG